MSTVNSKTFTRSVRSTDKAIDIKDQLTAGDSDAYTIAITWSDVDTIDGVVNLRFERGTTYWDRDSTDGVDLTGTTVTYTLDSTFYAAAGLVCWVQFNDSNLHTPLKVSFVNIRVPTGTTEVDTTETYPAWVSDTQTAEAGRVTAEGLRVTAEEGRVTAEGLRVTAENGRDTAEGLRVTAESGRDTAEGLRVTAEADRVDAEDARAVWEAYNGGTTYEVGNKVYYEGSSYICHTESTGNLPTDTNYWSIIAEAGAAGTIDTSTLTDLTGVIAGDGTNIRAATAADGDALPVTGGTLGAQLSDIDGHSDDLVTAEGGVHGLAVENGAWTPVFTSEIGEFGNITYASVHSGSYIKVGKLVVFNGAISTSSITINTASGNVYITGLPYNPAVLTSVSIGSLFRMDLSEANRKQPVLSSVNTSGLIRIIFHDTNLNAFDFLQVSDLYTDPLGNQIYISGSYVID